MLSVPDALRYLRQQLAAVQSALDQFDAAVNAESATVPASPQVTLIQQIVATHFGFTRAHMLKRDRHARVVAARQIAMALAYELTSATQQELITGFGRESHGTIMCATNAVRDRADTDRRFADIVALLRERVLAAIEPLTPAQGAPVLRVPAALGKASTGDAGKTEAGAAA